MRKFSLTEFTEVRPGIFTAVAEPASVNIGLVVGATGALVIDTGSSPAQGAEIHSAAEAVAGRPVTAVVVTHHHFDHYFGLGGFDGVPSYAHESVRPEAITDEASTTELGFDAALLATPTRPFALARTIDLGGVRAEVVHFGAGHTPGDVMVIVPDRQVVFAGDLLEEAAAPSVGSDSTLRGWPLAIDGMLGVLGEDWVVVPGHGRPVDRFFAFNQRAEISAIYGQVEHLIGQGITQAEALEKGEWPWPDEVISRLLPHAYAELARAGRVPRRQLPLA